MSKTLRIIRLFRICYFGVSSKRKWRQFGNALRLDSTWLVDYSIFNSLKYEFPKNKILYSFIYLTFVGLGAKNNQYNKKKLGETILDDDWKRERDVSQHISLAELALKEGKSKKAELILLNAVRLSESKPTVGIACVYDMLATLAYREGNIIKAKDFLEKVIKYLINTGTPSDHGSIVQFRLKLARILSKLGSSNEAEENFKICLDIQKLKCQVEVSDEEEEKLWINSLFWYGKHLSNNKKYLEAKECFDTAYTLTARTKSIHNSQVMVILFNLSEMSFMKGEKDEALRYLLNAVILGRLSNHPDLATYYNRIGLIYLSKGLLCEARVWCENGKEKGKRSRNKRAQIEGDCCIRQINEVLNIHKA